MLQESNNVAANLVVAIALVALAGAPMIGAVELDDAVILDGNMATVTLGNGQVREVLVEYQPPVRSSKMEFVVTDSGENPAKTSSPMLVQITEEGARQSFTFDGAKIEVEAGGKLLEISIANGTVTIGKVECDGAGGDRQCIADAIQSQIEVSPAAVLVAHAAIRDDLGSENMAYGDEIKATMHLMAEHSFRTSDPHRAASEQDQKN